MGTFSDVPHVAILLILRMQITKKKKKKEKEKERRLLGIIGDANPRIPQITQDTCVVDLC